MDFLKINQKLKIIPDEIKGISSGIIKEIYQDFFTVQLDKNNNSLAVGQNIEIIISGENCLTRFETKIFEIKGDIANFLIPEKFKNIQRREYTRININIPVNLKKPAAANESINTSTEDLSGGGMKVMSESSFDIDTLLEAKLSINTKKNIKTLIKILRVDTCEQNLKKYHLSGKFKEISNADRITIIQLCFKRQLELKCKGIEPG